MKTITVLSLALLLGACTSQELYQTGQGWQLQECRKLQDSAERSRCEKSNATSYERYEAERKAANKLPPL